MIEYVLSGFLSLHISRFPNGLQLPQALNLFYACKKRLRPSPKLPRNIRTCMILSECFRLQDTAKRHHTHAGPQSDSDE